ncbi:MAG TPA: NAD(P)-dependent alcohol dehydrogenase [Candidatus Binataceae bacterium]|nr:NAD(P)-dependent alcohol dehydrogenase [Candidatus Binataceae bacterium]
MRARAPHASLIYVATLHSDEYERWARAMGVNYYLAKPIESSRFASVLTSFLEHRATAQNHGRRTGTEREIKSMKAFAMTELDHVGLVDKTIPKPGPNDAVVRTTKALICTSDSHTVHGAIGPRHNLTLGHEAVGIVHEVGSEVKLFKPGDRVVVGAITPDWGDPASQAGHSSQSNGALGGWKFANLKDGVFAEYFHVNGADANMARIPDDVSEESAVYCCDMMSTGFMAAENADIPIGGTVAVFALGPVGLMAIAGAKLRGAGTIIGVDSIPARHELARFYGADLVVDHTKTDAVAEILKLTHNEGVDAAIEALGGNEAFQNAIKVTKPGGVISNAGYHGKGEFVAIPRIEWGVGMAEKTIRTGLCPGGRLRMERMLRLLQTKRIDPTRMTTHRFNFSEIEKAFQMMDKKQDGIIKPLISFS